jgi:hypothetical protein
VKLVVGWSPLLSATWSARRNSGSDDAEILRMVLDRYFDAMRATIRPHRG